AGLESIRALKSRFPDFTAGAGTVLTAENAAKAVQAGADFVVSPGYQDDIAGWCLERDIPVFPGCVTPCEIQLALQKGLRTVKFFPAGVFGGLKAIKALAAPFGPAGLKFMPTGGITRVNLLEYIQCPAVAAAGGGWLCPEDEIEKGNYQAVSEAASEAVSILLGFNPDVFSGRTGQTLKPAGPLKTNSLARAGFYLEKYGFRQEQEENGGSVILSNPGGLKIELVQK
ncbi:MAG: bifunctional 4-hydroxy-2-oxoglutarate aldolase/2-dehydro-3-deoxy-phosphogluconate aldolase, partial [Deltaproteobacteria bacterium]|nr:bifunctional 4-hydroxy-2-oxoglutarate aldolase/2-dehydro-3-deoxy-phosphogluconate aldolase [Deltaproteobacteria bacterium]